MDQGINGVSETEVQLDAQNDDNKSSVDSSNTNDVGDDEDDESSIDSNLLDFEPMTFNERILEELKSNYRGLDTVWMWNNQFDTLKIDWGKEGDSFADNTHLKSLDILCENDTPDIISERELRYTERNAKAFYRAISKNKSIRYLKIRGCIGNLDMADTLFILAPFIANNNKLRSLELGGCRLSNRFAQLFESALSGCNTTLQQFELNKCEGITVDIMKKVIEVVTSHPHIRDLSFDEYDWNDTVAEALGTALSNNNTLSNLESLSLGGLDYDYQEDRRGSMSAYGVEAALDFITSPCCSLKELSFRSNTIGPLGGIALAEALEGNTTLEKLNLSHAVSPWYGQESLTSQGWSTFFGSLHNCSFRNLDLGGNTIDDDDVASMVEALNSFGSLELLDLWKVPITSSGWVAFFNLLAQPGSVLERLKKLDLDGRNINDEVMVSIANALVNNASLEKIDWCFSDSVTKRGWSALETTLCNKTSIETICNSNHTFNNIHHHQTREVSTLTRLNDGTNKAEVTRQKIIRYYFLEGKGGNLHELMGMDLELLPHVLECFCKQEMEVPKDTWGSKLSNGKYTIKVSSGFELLYRVARGMPSLFDTEGKLVGGKRKRMA